MRYRKIALEMVVTDEDAEILILALGDAMDKIEKQVMVFNSDIKLLEKPEQKMRPNLRCRWTENDSLFNICSRSDPGVRFHDRSMRLVKELHFA